MDALLGPAVKRRQRPGAPAALRHAVLGDAESAALQAPARAERDSGLRARRREFWGAALRFGPPSERQAAGARDEARCAVSSADARDRRWAPEGRAAAAPGARARLPHGFATLHGDRCCPGHGPSARLGRRRRRGGRWQTTETAACCAASTTRHVPAQWRTASPSSGSVRCAARWRRKRPARRTSRVGPALAPIRRVPGVATRRRVVASGRAAGVRGFTLVSPEEIAETTVVKRRAERAN